MHPFGLIALVAVGAGPLDPPVGPVGPTMRTLRQVEPRTPVQELPGTADTQFAITQPGHYYLTGPITGVAGKHAIQVAAQDVVIDLSGFTISGVAGALDGILVGTLFVPRQNVAIVGGTVRGFPGRGINAQYAANVRIERIHAIANGDIGIKAGNGISGPAGGIILACMARENGGAGIHAESASVVSCTSMSNSGRGITVLGGAAEGCIASLNAGDGFGGSGTLTNCSAIANLGDGINFSGTVRGCRASNNGGQGVDVAAGSVVESCRGTFNELEGFVLEDGAAILWCTARDNGDDGIELRANGLARGNTCIANGRTSASAAGIAAVNTGNRIDENTVAQNPYGVRTYSGSNLVVRNSAGGSGVANFDFAPGSATGEIVSGAGVIGDVSSWANFSLDAD